MSLSWLLGRNTTPRTALDYFTAQRQAPEPHRGNVRRHRTWCPTRHAEVLGQGWRWRCSCLAWGRADSRVQACNAYWDHFNRRTA